MIDELLKNLVKNGAALASSEPGMPVTPLADATFLGETTLWFCATWPENDFAQHWITFDRAVENHGMIDVIAGDRIFTIASMEPEERTASRWTDWIGEKGRELRGFVSGLKQNALTEAK